MWLPKYYEQSIAEEENPNGTGVLLVYPQGFFYAFEVDTETFDTLSDLAEIIDARGVDMVHYSEPLNRMTKVLCRGEHKGCHIAMAVDRDGYAKDLPDNMPGTLLYGHGMEIRGTVILLLEDDKYNLKPIKGVAFFNMCIKMLNAATAGLTRFPTEEEVNAIESTFDASEEYDDPDLIDDDEENEEDVPSMEENDDAESTTLTVKLEESCGQVLPGSGGSIREIMRQAGAHPAGGVKNTAVGPEPGFTKAAALHIDTAPDMGFLIDPVSLQVLQGIEQVDAFVIHRSGFDREADAFALAAEADRAQAVCLFSGFRFRHPFLPGFFREDR